MLKRKPSDAETAILQILWENQPCTVRAIHEALSETKAVGYTTVLKQVQRMHDKGFVSREDGQGRSHIYKATIGEADTKTRLVDRFVKTAFDGSVPDLVMHALGSDGASGDDIAKIRALLDELERGDGDTA